ncbi:MAG: hypothetical protein AAF499_00520 [Pseudomonadota bacterium]
MTILSLSAILFGCAAVRAPDRSASANWSNPVLPALVQPDPYPEPARADADWLGKSDEFNAAILDEFDAQSRFDLVAEGVPCGEVFTELARHASLSLAVQLPLDASVWLRVSERPLAELLEAVSSQCHCRTVLEPGVIKVLPDIPYLHSYAVDYLNIRREFTTALNVDMRVGAKSNEAVSSSATSTSSLQSALQTDPWQTVVEGLEGMLEQTTDDNRRVSVHREAGLITVNARRATHAAVQRYLDRIVSRLQRQVLIEASVIEIALDERHASGVDWRRVAENSGLGWVQSLGSGINAGAEEGGAVLQYSSASGSHSTTTAVKLLQQFGDVRVISTPRLVALNNQPSVLKVVDNTVYFSLDVATEVNSERGLEKQSVKSTIHTVPVGLVMHVTPQISKAGAVSMNIRPSISRIVRYARDPNPALAVAGVSNDIPEIQVREIETTLRVRSGHTVALGGLRQLTDGTHRDTVPGLERIPFIGRLFRSRNAARQQVELLILLTPHVLPAEGVV